MLRKMNFKILIITVELKIFNLNFLYLLMIKYIFFHKKDWLSLVVLYMWVEYELKQTFY